MTWLTNGAGVRSTVVYGLVGLVIATGTLVTGVQPGRSAPVQPLVIDVDSVETLERFYRRYDYGLRDVARGRYVILRDIPSDFPSIRSTSRRKRLFQRIVLPIIYLENDRIARRRARIRGLKDRLVEPGHSRPGRVQGLRPEEFRFLAEMLVHYEVIETGSDLLGGMDHGLVTKLLDRVNQLPPAMALAQAATETGWGTSRYCLQGNNLFGHQTYDLDKPRFEPRRIPGEPSYALRKFTTLRASVRTYMHNLNTHHAYRTLRRLRRQYNPHRSLKLLPGLRRYSIRRREYVQRVARVIRSNRYRRFDHLQ